MRVYLAGPMRGEPWHGFPEFVRAERALRAAGHDVRSPADPEDLDEHGEPRYSLAYYLRRDVQMIAQVQAIVLLPGWRRSQGVAFEVQVAQALDMLLFELTWSGPALDEANLKEVTDDLGPRSWEDERRRVVASFEQ